MNVWKVCLGLVWVVAVTGLGTGTAWGDAFNDYGPITPFSLPASSPFDVLNDGRLVTLDGADVYTETAVGSRSFTQLGTLTGMDVPGYGAAFIRVSPDGARIAVGNSGGASWNNYEVGIFNLWDDVTGQWFDVDHYGAEWYDNGNLGLTAGAMGPTRVTLLDVESLDNPVVVENIGGASAGITFDALGNLYTGNGYRFAGPSDTGWIKAFEPADWMAPLTGGDPADFEDEPTLIADLLSAGSLGFDGEGNLYVGGGDLYSGSGDYDYGALVRHNVVNRALDDLDAADPSDPDEVRTFDPDPDTLNNSNAYYANYNFVTGELYFREGATVYPYIVPEPASLLLLAAGMAMVVRRRVR
ncbi:MAG: PEP-CTERM sorting domain-containing protein [Planctomycetota bacterium]